MRLRRRPRFLACAAFKDEQPEHLRVAEVRCRACSDPLLRCARCEGPFALNHPTRNRTLDPPPDAPRACSILSLVGLMGAGVAVGSGVAMMSMAEDSAAASKPAVAAHSIKEAKLAPVSGARGFAASK